MSEPKLLNFVAGATFFTLSYRDIRFVSFLSLQDIFLVMLFGMLIGSKSRPRVKNSLIFAGLFFAIIQYIFSTLVTSNQQENATTFIKILLAYAMLSISLYWYCTSDFRVSLMVKFFIAGNILSNILLTLGFGDINTNGRNAGFGGHPIFVGTTSAITFLLLLRIFTRNLVGYISLLAGLPLSLVGMLSAQSSTAFVLLALGLLLLIVANWNYKRNTGILLSQVSVLCFFLFSYFNLTIFAQSRSRLMQSINPTHSFTLTTGDNSTLLARKYSLIFSWEKIQNHIVLGNGFDSRSRLTKIGLEPHNILFNSWQTGGLLFLSAVCLLLIYSVRCLFTAFKINNSVSMIFILAIWITLMTGPALYDRSLLAPLFVGLIYSSKLPLAIHPPPQQPHQQISQA